MGDAEKSPAWAYTVPVEEATGIVKQTDDAAIVELVTVTAYYYNFIYRAAPWLGVRLDETLENAAEPADSIEEEARLSGAWLLSCPL